MTSNLDKHFPHTSKTIRKDLFGELLDIVIAAKTARERAAEMEERVLYILELEKKIKAEAKHIHDIAENLVSTARSTAEMAMSFCENSSLRDMFHTREDFKRRISFVEFATILDLTDKCAPEEKVAAEEEVNVAIERQTESRDDENKSTDEITNTCNEIRPQAKNLTKNALPSVWEERTDLSPSGVPAKRLEVKQGQFLENLGNKDTTRAPKNSNRRMDTEETGVSGDLSTKRRHGRPVLLPPKQSTNCKPEKEREGENDAEVEALMITAPDSSSRTARERSPVKDLVSEENKIDDNIEAKINGPRARSLSPRDRTLRPISPRVHRRAPSPLLNKEEQELIEVSSGESLNSFRAKQRIKIPSRASSPSPARSNSSHLVTNGGSVSTYMTKSPANHSAQGSSTSINRLLPLAKQDSKLAAKDKYSPKITCGSDSSDHETALESEAESSTQETRTEDGDDRENMSGLPTHDPDSGLGLNMTQDDTCINNDITLQGNNNSVEELPPYPNILEPSGESDETDNDALIPLPDILTGSGSEADVNNNNPTTEERTDFGRLRISSSGCIKATIRKFERRH